MFIKSHSQLTSLQLENSINIMVWIILVALLLTDQMENQQIRDGN